MSKRCNFCILYDYKWSRMNRIRASHRLFFFFYKKTLSLLLRCECVDACLFCIRLDDLYKCNCKCFFYYCRYSFIFFFQMSISNPRTVSNYKFSYSEVSDRLLHWLTAFRFFLPSLQSAPQNMSLVSFLSSAQIHQIIFIRCSEDGDCQEDIILCPSLAEVVLLSVWHHDWQSL